MYYKLFSGGRGFSTKRIIRYFSTFKSKCLFYYFQKAASPACQVWQPCSPSSPPASSPCFWDSGWSRRIEAGWKSSIYVSIFDLFNLYMCQVSGVRCHLSPVTCDLSHVTCHVSPVKCKEKNSIQFFFKVKRRRKRRKKLCPSEKIGKSGGASRWRVCYQVLTN